MRLALIIGVVVIVACALMAAVAYWIDRSAGGSEDRQ
jgi:hypothetical protein